ncbi:vegetative cell wall protein gp1 [Manduca sexta]|uniref:vegetative cell wall protein gp1 n=1 Tax=Manduca sexta TaxID=7130 RepID=UPI001181E6EB|nr:vegetative cell wall protein gp1 [Manduca sexta]
MEFLWRQIFWFFIISALNNVAIFAYNVPSGLSLPSLRFWKEEGKKLVSSPPSLNAVRTDNPLLSPTGVPECQPGFQLQDGIGPTVPSTIIPPQILPPVPLPPPIINCPLLQKPPSPVPLVHSCPALATPSSLPGIPPILPTPPILPVGAPSLSDLPHTYGPPVTLDNRIQPFQKSQIAFNNIPPTPVMPYGCLSPSIMERNLPPPIFESAALVPPSQARVIEINSCSSVPASSEFSSQTISFETPHNCPTFIQPGTATIIPAVPQYANQNTFVPIVSDVSGQSGYQITVLPSLSSIQTASESIASPISYTYTPIPSGTDNSVQSPVNVQLNSPEQSPAMPMPMPFPPPAPIIMMKSGSSWKRWLPALLVSLFTRPCQGGGCCSCSSCDNPDNVYVPYPIPMPTNNPIILSGDQNDGDDEDDCDEEIED